MSDDTEAKRPRLELEPTAEGVPSCSAAEPTMPAEVPLLPPEPDGAMTEEELMQRKKKTSIMKQNIMLSEIKTICERDTSDDPSSALKAIGLVFLLGDDIENEELEIGRIALPTNR